MSVDFYACDNCGKTFPDCGRYYTCNCDCGRHWCSLECAEEEGYEIGEDKDEEDNTTCSFCRNESFEDCELLKFLLKKYKLTYTQVEKQYRETLK